MAKTNGYTIRKRGKGWQANLSRRLTGEKRIQITRQTKVDAEAEAKRQLQKLTDYGSDYLNFTPEQLRAFGEAIRSLAEKNFPATAISEAVRFYMEHNDPHAQKRTVSEVLAEFLESKGNAGLSPLTLVDYNHKLTRFANQFGKRYMHSITPTEIEQWLDAIQAHGTTRKNYRRNVNIFYRFAIGRKYTRENSAAAVTKVKVQRSIPTILTPQEIRVLLFAARKHNLGRMLPYFAIGCLCGLRPWEIRRTSWSDINLDGMEIYVTPEACKTAQDRFVTIPDNLAVWLKECVPLSARNGLIPFSRADFDAIRKAAHLFSKWDSDIMRHSAASHLYAKTQNAALVTAQMGHGLNIFLKHYKRSVTKADGEAYFRVLPTDSESNIVELKAVNQ